jgi:ABC-type Fe3+/spermidine/putrescine transport system ATPase subunit
VTHDQDEALTMSDRIAVMHAGRIVQEGTPREIYEHPTTRFVADFIGLTNFFVGKVVSEEQDRTLVETDALRIWCAGHLASPGNRVTVAVRPEKIEMTALPPSTALNVWAGQVLSGTFLGEQTEYRVRLERNQEVVIRRQNLQGNGSNPPTGPGARVYVSWLPEVSLVLPAATN